MPPFGTSSDPVIHRTPNGLPLNLNAIAEECRATVVDRNGFTEPTVGQERVELNGAEVLFSVLFRNAIVPICDGVEHARKGRAVEAADAFKEAASSLVHCAQRLKYYPDDLTKLSIESLECLIRSKLMLDVTELAEVHRNGYNFRDFVDLIIRMMSTAASMQVDLDAFMADEMAHNNTRAHKHGKLA